MHCSLIFTLFVRMEQRLARGAHDPKCVGSNPTSNIRNEKFSTKG